MFYRCMVMVYEPFLAKNLVSPCLFFLVETQIDYYSILVCRTENVKQIKKLPGVSGQFHLG